MQVYRGTHQRGEQIRSGKPGKCYCRWASSKAEAEKPESIRQFLEKLKPVSRRGKNKGRGNRRKQSHPKQNGAPKVVTTTGDKVVTTDASKGTDILDLIAQIKANEIMGASAELNYSAQAPKGVKKHFLSSACLLLVAGHGGRALLTHNQGPSQRWARFLKPLKKALHSHSTAISRG
jgi:hypothetical protein